MKSGDAPNTAAEMRSLADQAEAEAAEAEALAAAARARARAIQLRREAEVADTETAEVEKPAKPTRPARSPKPARLTKPATKGPAEEATVGAAEPDTESEPRTAGDETVTFEKVPREPSTVKLAKVEAAEEAKLTEPLGEQAEDAELEDTEAEESDAESGRRRLAWPSQLKPSAVAAVVAVLVSLAAVGASVEMAMLHKKAERERAQVNEFAAAAKQGVVTLTSLDYEHAQQGVTNVLEVSTGGFKADFLKAAQDFTSTIEQSKVISQGTVQNTAVDLDTITDNSATVLVASTQEVTNSAGAKQEPRKYRLIVEMTRDGRQLKMSKVEFVP